jgi:HK97 family phage portal protein
MGFLTELFATRQHPSGHGQWERWFSLGNRTYAGVDVTEESALTLSAYFACIRVISESVAMLPLLTYRYLPNGGRERASDHPVYWLLKEQPNPEMSAFEFRETITAHCAGWGNGYAEIEWSKIGRPIALWPLHPGRMQVKRVNRELRYLYTDPDGRTANLPAWRVHHFRGPSNNGVVGYSMARKAAQSIGLALATEEYGSRFFGNGARPGVVLKHPGLLSDEAYSRLKNSYEADHQGLSNAHRIKILEEGMDLETIGIPPEEAQFLETRKFQVAEVARWFRIPAHMINDLEKATFSNIEEQGLEFVIYTLTPWLVRSEQALMRDLMTREERQRFFIRYLASGLLRGNSDARSKFYATAIQNGWMSPNEVRILEDLNPYAGGDVYLLPLNMTPADEAGSGQQSGVRALVEGHTGQQSCRCAACQERRADDEEAGDQAEGESEETAKIRRSKQKLARDFVPVFEDVAGRVVRREVNDIRRAINKHLRRRSLADFLEWLETFYADFAAVVRDAFKATLLTYAGPVTTAVADELGKNDPGVTDELKAFIDEYLEALATGWVASSRNQIDALITDAEADGADGADIADAIEERLDGWEESQPGKVSLRQAFEAGNALAVAMYGYFSVQYLMWAASGKSCPFCQRLNGKIVGIEKYFVGKGEFVNGGPDDAPLLVRRNTRHGPLHKSCDCVVVAA